MLFTKGFPFTIFVLGFLLELVIGDKCSPNPCKNSGRCSTTADGYFYCNCDYGWKGSTCEKNIDDCSKNPCKNAGQCIDQSNSRYICKCSKGFVGDICQFANPCLIKNPCSNDAQCEPLEDGNFSCKCKNEFTGKTCKDKFFKCPENLNDTRESCSNHGICHEEPNYDLSCKCDEGFSGKYCEKPILPSVIGCEPNSCGKGTCKMEKDGSPKCHCPEGYTGEQCSKKIEMKVKEPHTNNKSLKIVKDELLIKQKQKTSENKCKIDCINLIGNGICNKQCNTYDCNFDGGDCDPWKRCKNTSFGSCSSVFNNGICNPECNSVDCLFDGGDCQKLKCYNHGKCSKVYQNKVCDEECNNPQCGFDGGDCPTKRTNSFFGSDSGNRCSSQTKVFELDLILMTPIKYFDKKKLEFLQKLSSSLKMVVTIVNSTEIDSNFTKIKLYVNHTQCIIYGGQCFSSLDQISNFLKAGIENGNALSLPFKVAKVETKVIMTRSAKKHIDPFTMILVSIGLGLIITSILIGVLLRDKWGKLRTKIKTAGVWTPSDGYSTSTSSINSGQKPGWMNIPQMKDFKKEFQIPNKFVYNDNNYKLDQHRHFNDNHESEKIKANYNRKRKYEISNRNDKVSSFQLISDSIENSDGINPIDSNFTDIYDLQSPALEGLGDYVNENGESLMHLAARMNCGPSVIKQLNSISPPMLQTLDEWGRTPLASSIAADAVESVEQLILLEKQLRKESKQNKSRQAISGISSGVSCEYLVKKTTALIEAVKLDSKEIINLLLDEGNPVNVLDTYGRSVVHWAVMFNNTILLERLSHMKIFQKLADLKDYEDKSPLYFAANEGSLECVKFLLDYFNKNGIKIDSNCPCPKLIAEEKGFHEIKDIIGEALRKVTFVEKHGKRMKLKDTKLRSKIPNFDNPSSNLCIIDEYKELSANSIEHFPNSPIGNESMDSCLLELYSITDPSLQNTNELNLCSSFKPMEYRYQGYQSNTSSSDMSPPLLNLNNPQFQNGFNPITYSDSLDPNFNNTIFMSPKSFLGQPDQNHTAMKKNQIVDHPIDYYNFQTSPTISEYQHHSINLSNFPPLNCSL